MCLVSKMPRVASSKIGMQNPLEKQLKLSLTEGGPSRLRCLKRRQNHEKQHQIKTDLYET